MWVLLREGDVIREGDESFYPRKDVWVPMAPHITFSGRNTVTDCDLPIRRNVTGWEAVKYALKQEVIGNGKEGEETTEDYWDCECEDDRVHSKTEIGLCLRGCRAAEEGSPQSRKAEVILKIIGE